VTAKNVMRLFTELAGECALVVVSHDHRLVEENGFRCLRLDVDGGDGSINTTLRG
jgi:putative ABC transport system ATP-binding protein